MLSQLVHVGQDGIVIIAGCLQHIADALRLLRILIKCLQRLADRSRLRIQCPEDIRLIGAAAVRKKLFLLHRLIQQCL